MKMLDRHQRENAHVASNRPSNRREMLKTAIAAVGGLAAAPSLPAAAVSNSRMQRSAVKAQSDRLVALDSGPIVETARGKVIGYVRDGIHAFKGIPYADSTKGTNRFRPPEQAQPWSGVRSSRAYGHVAPQRARTGWANDEEAFMFAWDDGIPGEDCLRVNLWTPGVNDHRKRPVMVWLHGGGFAAGSGQELRSYDGENLARRGDVVVVSLNHRLNVLGHLDLSKYGERYAASANVGMLDIVAALEWVRANIAAFGGDPGRVTIFGQSGGGAKVGTLMAMPSAKGLFHRAIIESGSMLRAGTQDMSQSLADQVVAELGLTTATIDRIQLLPNEQLLAASGKVLDRREQGAPRTPPNFYKFAELLGFVPVVDGTILPAHPFDPQAPLLSADVPMIIGTTLNEFVTAINHPEAEAMTESELEQNVTAMFGEKAKQIVAAFRRRTPAENPFDLWSRIAASAVRGPAIAQAKLKAAQGRAPAYLYWFTWKTPILNGRPRAIHCSEIAFVFDNTDRCETMTGGGADARQLAGLMCDAWVHFARTGNPNHPGMPHWSACTDAQAPTMIFDNKTQLVLDPDKDEQRSIPDAWEHHE